MYTCRGQLDDHYCNLEEFQTRHSYEQEVMKTLLALKVEKFYTDNREDLENMENNIKYVVPLAVNTSEITEDLATDLPENPGNDVGKLEADFKYFVKKVDEHTNAAANTTDTHAGPLKEIHLGGLKEA
ncbi:hypothetical protein BGZ81_011369 [Podila clonocystis]|nr:hypothetical protein BGZ81_011369 [Podila clonocystis]